MAMLGAERPNSKVAAPTDRGKPKREHDPDYMRALLPEEIHVPQVY